MQRPTGYPAVPRRGEFVENFVKNINGKEDCRKGQIIWKFYWVTQTEGN